MSNYRRLRALTVTQGFPVASAAPRKLSTNGVLGNESWGSSRIVGSSEAISWQELSFRHVGTPNLELLRVRALSLTGVV
jgi:hypothetical protein